MRKLKTNIVSSIILNVILCGAAVAAPASVGSQPAATVDCQKMGSEVSALIDKGGNAPNAAAARATFQVGIMECMEGDDTTANSHYQEAKELLSNGQRKVLPPIKTAAVTPAAIDNRDCQQVGGEVSALIDSKVNAPNLSAARALFQVGIMQCMEGDDATANVRYQEAKALLNNDPRKTPAAPAKP